ncbi:hypothetical protein NE237_004942 [Protea cynaroides]|uniref:Uncharacterized protein n=1 Tax=Protea cynaroides TaxID=273540 RepID=A0A9Q0KJN8_9MAGN|nr:hypothetical protein NE237_004942 [Protea cynaroides]
MVSVIELQVKSSFAKRWDHFCRAIWRNRGGCCSYCELLWFCFQMPAGVFIYGNFFIAFKLTSTDVLPPFGYPQRRTHMIGDVPRRQLLVFIYCLSSGSGSGLHSLILGFRCLLPHAGFLHESVSTKLI